MCVCLASPQLRRLVCTCVCSDGSQLRRWVCTCVCVCLNNYQLRRWVCTCVSLDSPQLRRWMCTCVCLDSYQLRSWVCTCVCVCVCVCAWRAISLISRVGLNHTCMWTYRSSTMSLARICIFISNWMVIRLASVYMHCNWRKFIDLPANNTLWYIHPVYMVLAIP